MVRLDDWNDIHMTRMIFDEMMDCMDCAVEVIINIKRYIHITIWAVIVYNRCKLYIQE